MEIEDYKVPEVELPESIQSTDKVVDTSTMEFYPAVKDAKEAHEVCRRLIEDNRYRNERNAKIARRYNDDQPYSQSELNAAGQSWRSNFSSGFLSTLIKRALPSYKRVVDEARTLTLSELDQQGAENREREEAYRINITRTIRRWYGWNDLITQIGLENLLYGYAAVIRPDEIDWRPVFARQDEIFFQKQLPSSQIRHRISVTSRNIRYGNWPSI